MCNKNDSNNKNIFYIIGLIVAAVTVIAGAVITVTHFLNKNKKTCTTVIDCEDGDCEGCELSDQCHLNDTEEESEE